MNKIQEHLLVFILISSLALISSVLAIKCWDCSSHINPGCGDPFYNHSFALVDCDQKFLPHISSKATLCRKITQKVENDVRPRVIRGCGWLEDENQSESGCVTRSGTFSVLVEYCACKEDGCNGQRSLVGNPIVTLGTLSLLLLWLKL